MTFLKDDKTIFQDCKMASLFNQEDAWLSLQSEPDGALGDLDEAGLLHSAALTDLKAAQTTPLDTHVPMASQSDYQCAS